MREFSRIQPEALLVEQSSVIDCVFKKVIEYASDKEKKSKEIKSTLANLPLQESEYSGKVFPWAPWLAYILLILSFNKTWKWAKNQLCIKIYIYDI